MKRYLFATILALSPVFASDAAQAQFGPGFGGPRDDYYDGGRPRYRDRDRGPYYGEEDAYQPRRYRRRGGTTCVTSRGSCAIGRPFPLNSPCSCDVPGFGRKRGAVSE